VTASNFDTNVIFVSLTDKIAAEGNGAPEFRRTKPGK